MLKRLFMFSMVLLLALPVMAQDAPETNLTTGCVTDYNPDVDYFPQKVAVEYATGFDVAYFNHYKIVTVANSGTPYTYVLVQCGTPTPETTDLDGVVQVIDVPAGNIVTLSTTYLPHLSALGLVDQLAGMDSFLYTSTPEVIERIETGDIIEVAPDFNVNIELVFETDPTIVMTGGFDPDQLATLIDAGIFTALNTDYLETSPLGQAEWLKYTALFYNQEAVAADTFDDIVAAYEEATNLAATIADENRPTVLWNFAFNGNWSIPGANTIPGTLIQDAGGVVAMGDDAPPSGTFLSLESVYEGALDADIWVINAFAVSTIDELLAQDERYGDFAAVEAGQVWNNDADVNANFGNNYYERGVLRPDLVLRDLVAMFHPQLLPDHEFEFFRNLD